MKNIFALPLSVIASTSREITSNVVSQVHFVLLIAATGSRRIVPEAGKVPIRQGEEANNSHGCCCNLRPLDMACLLWHDRFTEQYQHYGLVANLL